MTIKEADLTAATTRRVVQIIEDAMFRGDMWLSSTSCTPGGNGATPAPPAFTIGRLPLFDEREAPAWRLAQWGTRHSLQGTASTVVPPEDARMLGWGGIQYRNEGKRIATDGKGHLLLEVYGSREADEARSGLVPLWPHLLVEQTFMEPPRLVELDSFVYAFDVKVHFLHNALEGHDIPHRDLHAAQLVSFFALGEPDGGDFLWFGIPIADSRIPTHEAAAYCAGDDHPNGTYKFINTGPGADFWETDLRDGQWHHLRRDLVGPMRRAYERAKEQGYLRNSDLGAMHIRALTFGWEVPGLYDCSAQLANLSAEATYR